ncbi:uncharacterized protein CTHT_0013910 [Thermochaetoides thermophila DSM 1495]|uniref:Methyltransferase-like protein n=1 Tax=Chaetomium thermophilum (strain DSM 1495 / CBS 144.50 / IMI 039719) TaxID=759272 RepID=G0S1K3_CHATD|nr:hypothetical protein CTHT_0013910 [Thermochaetoides thermophila DSM 1495]EGS22913.1 hypothetical protein CTHT_0013910 [Thermochaetoides thermophila DSM 1495]
MPERPSCPAWAPAPAEQPSTAAAGATDLPQNFATLEADDANDNSDVDSVITTGNLSETTSVASSIYRFRVENGRTYHAYKANENDYFLPNDERENERLDLQHAITLKVQHNKLYICPAGKDKPLRRVLDVGCGTGIWSLDFGDEHPETSVVGVDLSPIQPSFVPPNVEFFIDDVQSPWTYSSPFDFIYMRYLTGSIRNWPALLQQAYEHTSPGGWIEICDPVNPCISDDGTLTEDSALLKWNRLLVEGSNKLGASMEAIHNMKRWVEETGYVNVTKVEYKWPINGWPKDQHFKEVGLWSYEAISSGLQALSLFLFTKVLGWSVEEVETFLVDVRKDLKNKNIHAYWPVYVIYGQKPE